MKIGAQLYTIREYTKNAADFAASMEKIARTGYRYVQISAIGDIPAKEVADVCASNGLEIVVTHTNQDKVRDDYESVIEDHRIMGAKYVGIGAMPGNYPRSESGVMKFIEDYTPAAEAFEKSGMMFMYHNHDFEFEKYGKKSMFDYLIGDFPLVGFILDTYWVQAAGGDPSAWIKKLSGRVPVIHFKDMTWARGGIRMAEVMEGNMNWPAIFAACPPAGVEYAMVEQDHCYERNPFDSLKISFDNLKGVFANG